MGLGRRQQGEAALAGSVPCPARYLPCFSVQCQEGDTQPCRVSTVHFQGTLVKSDLPATNLWLIAE